jgi:two-component system, cell cycle sensor histidine kinase and response regulator CckA
VTVTKDGAEALLSVEEKGAPPDLLITDVVMPGMSGPVLVERLLKIHPGLKVLYMSGYTDSSIVHHGILDPGTPFLQKPFNRNDLAVKVEELLWKTDGKS